MNTTLRAQAETIVTASIHAVLPDEAVRRALQGFAPAGRVFLAAAGKAAWQMAHAAVEVLGRPAGGVVITKYGHVKGEIPGVTCYEAAHPVPDEAGFAATEKALALVHGLTAQDAVLFLLSGGGSALLEKPLIPGAELQDITSQLLASGADIVEMNTIRKRLSAVKGGRFAQACAPAQVLSIILSDVVGDREDMIASGPACADRSTAREAMEIVAKYKLRLSPEALALMQAAPVSELPNARSLVTGGVGQLCEAARAACERRGYAADVLTSCLCCEAREAGTFLGCIAVTHAQEGRRAYIAGGETVVHLRGRGKGGRNQELALSAAQQIHGLANVAVLSLGSDGTDGPTDAAGGVVDGASRAMLEAKGLKIFDILDENNAYAGLQACDGLLVTGPTGTNVNDVSIVLIGD